MAMNKVEKKKKLLNTLSKLEEQYKNLKKKIKELEKPGPELTPAQQQVFYSWHGLGALEYMKLNPDSEFAAFVHEYLDSNVKNKRQRKLFGLNNAVTPENA